ncbi:hypothetical protein B0T26DRAFT_435508 [Lasiosphaeria miniovina]|uniref:Uncharacterized protein n=1 Tax=Lasiosphaeria miniovina TaxID=1954250 RepID=A0AA40A6N2_9PEZI|nr:uncharacterized protein B0T26DRAFT_435508 [Lasiosphaeria miniovina]KAK0710303.1 hypothetical protein B0T26DRAFT_435508 [Lasiosphaeria miniovina]
MLELKRLARFVGSSTSLLRSPLEDPHRLWSILFLQHVYCFWQGLEQTGSPSTRCYLRCCLETNHCSWNNCRIHEISFIYPLRPDAVPFWCPVDRSVPKAQKVDQYSELLASSRSNCIQHALLRLTGDLQRPDGDVIVTM